MLYVGYGLLRKRMDIGNEEEVEEKYPESSSVLPCIFSPWWSSLDSAF